MEALLSLAFDNLSSYDGPKIRKGLRQVEGLLAQICLSSPHDVSPPSSPAARSPPSSPSPPSSGKSLAELASDLAFREFFKLQDGFEWNVVTRLVGVLDRLMGRAYDDGQNDLLFLGVLDLIQGLLLLHPPSKALFSREQNMNLLLDLLEPVNCPAIQSSTLLTLVTALIDTPRNTRAFESLDGLLAVTSLFKSRSTTREVKLKLVEFLYFYLMPEVPPSSSPPSGPTAAARRGAHRRNPSKLGGGGGGGGGPGQGGEWADTLTTEEKQELLGRHLSSVEDLVRDLRDSTPFGGASLLC